MDREVCPARTASDLSVHFETANPDENEINRVLYPPTWHLLERANVDRLAGH